MQQPMAAGPARGVLSQLFHGVTGVAAWFVGSMFTNLGLLKFSWVGRVAPGRKNFFTEAGSSADAAATGRRYALHSVSRYARLFHLAVMQCI